MKAVRRSDGITTGMGNAERLRVLRADAKARGLCQECRCRFPRLPLTTCDVCLQRHYARERRYEDSGLCACGKRPRGGRKQCTSCIKYQERRTARLVTRRVADGLCPRCGHHPPAPERVACFGCPKLTADRVRASYYRRRP